MKYLSFIGFLYAFFLMPITTLAQEKVDSVAFDDEVSLDPARFYVSCSSLGLSVVNMLDTYISPFNYNGIGLSYNDEQFRKRTWKNHKLAKQTVFSIRLSAQDFESSNEYSLLIEKNWGALYEIALTNALTLYVGGQIQAEGGILYLPANSNNYISGKARLGLAMSGMGVYHFNCFNLPFNARYQLDIPVAGVMFAPEYGQSYYEIFGEGHYENTIVFYSLHNSPSMKHTLSLDFPFNIGKWQQTMRFSYIANFYQSRVHELKTHFYTHSFMLGFVKTLYNVKRKDKLHVYTPY